MDKQEFSEKYKFFIKDWPVEKLDDLQDFLTCEYTDSYLSRLYQSFHKTKSVRTRLEIVNMFKEYMVVSDEPTRLDIICKRLGLDDLWN